MAVVQISKIQHRRGRKGASDIPQLASGELGWAVDTQELYIGNGSVSEGAPFVGNTRILTENDSIFNLALAYYQYKDDSSLTSRTLQSRLDDRVSVNGFGANGNGVYNNTIALQTAIDKLFLNDASKGTPGGSTVLEFPAGEFIINQSLKLPTNTNIRGAGKGKTVITQTGNFPVFETINSTSTTNFYKTLVDLTSLTQPKNIDVSGITFKNTSPGYPVAVFNSAKDSTFRDVAFEGTWVSAQDPENPSGLTADEIGVSMTALDNLVTCKNNLFENCSFTKLSYAVASEYDIDSNIIKDCTFNSCGLAINFGLLNGSVAGKLFGPTNNKIISCRFEDIDRQGILISKGKGNLSNSNKFFRVGNNGGSSATATYAVVQFIEVGNVSQGDYFERSVDLTSLSSYVTGPNSKPYISEFNGRVIAEHKFNNVIPVNNGVITPTVLFRLSAFNAVRYRINYKYQTSTELRSGVLYLTINKNASILNRTQWVDEYDFRGDGADDAFTLSATLANIGTDLDYNTILIQYTNSGAAGTFNYWYDVIS